ncbi:MAG: monooxygenase [Methanobacteriota archaeon]|nr:MAG: monooxygenase [Euryarchaeota archaeon]
MVCTVQPSMEQPRVCVIGAGPSGITAAKHLLQVGLTDFIVYDKNSEVGGNWVYSPNPSHSSVYETSHIISSKKLSQYHDYPMPDWYPDYPGHELLKAYFQNYADHFGVTPFIKFNTSVKKAVMNGDLTWTISLDTGEEETFDYLIVANGHHWNPRYPDFPGEFTGKTMHSHYYRTNIPFKDKRVLVVGGGNSACDIAVDISRFAKFTGLSWRRGYYVVPKLLLGMPPDVLNAKIRWLPEWMRRRMFYLLWKMVVGSNEKYGLPKPDHKLLETHPILNSSLLDRIRHGDINPRPNIERFEGNSVVFTDGSSEEYDAVIFGTGYKINFPFFDYPELDFSEKNYVDLYLKMFHPKFPTLGIIGLVQPQGCIWPLSDTQGQIMANYIVGNYQWPNNIEKRIEKDRKKTLKKYLKTPRHSTEVDYHEFQKKLFKEVPKNAPKTFPMI